MTTPDPETDREIAVASLLKETWLGHFDAERYADAVLTALRQRGRLVGEWIACSDKQPPNTGDQVLVASPGALGWLVTTDEWDADRCEACVISGVTNWMPLPPPPRVPGEGTAP